MATYTIFCQEEITGEGKIWIQSVEAQSVDEAAQRGQEACAADWGFEPDYVHVLGVAAGEVDILAWSDLGDD